MLARVQPPGASRGGTGERMSNINTDAGDIWGICKFVRAAWWAGLATSRSRNAGRFEPSSVSCFRATRATSALLVTLIASPALAERGAYTAEMQEKQVSRALHQIFDEKPSDKAWYWDRMVEVCTKTMMYGDPEQDPEGGRVRFTDRALTIMIRCADQKGFVRFPQYRD